MMPPFLRSAAIALALTALLPGPVWSQGADVAFGGIQTDPTLPVEVTSDNLSVNQADGLAVFTGNVVIVQGQMRLAAPEVRVIYAKDDLSRIESMTATGGVTLASTDTAAEGKDAVYTVDSGTVVMTGEVLLTQGQSTMAGEKLTVNLADGTGRMEGRVRTILLPKGN